MTTTAPVEHGLLDRVRELRATGMTPKQVARALGMRPAAVTPLVRRIAEQDARAHVVPELVACWVSPGWDGGLTVDAHPDWSAGTADEGHAGMACVAIVRRHRSRRLSVCGYLVDTHCLGVKATIGPRLMNEGELPAFLRMFFAAYDEIGPSLEAPLELARHLVWGAVDAARRLGFEPAADFATTAGHLGPWDQDSAITFGRDGVPCYVEGPYDDGVSVLRTLTRTVGAGNFHFVLAVGSARTR